MKHLLLILLTTTSALAAPGDIIVQRENAGSPKYTQILLTPDNGKVLGWNGTTLQNLTVASSWASITGKPTTLTGYGITDAASSSDLSTKANLSGGNSFSGTQTFSGSILGASISATSVAVSGGFTGPGPGLTGTASGLTVGGLANGTISGTVAFAPGADATFRTALGGTTVGQSLFTLTNPGAVTYPRFNSDNSVSALSASAFRTAAGAAESGANTTITGITSSTALTLASAAATDINITPGTTGIVKIGSPSAAAVSPVGRNGLVISLPSTTVGALAINAENQLFSSSTAGAFCGLYSNDGAAMTSGDRLGGFLIGGSSSSGTLRNATLIAAFASENWSDGSANGALLTFETTANGSTSRTEKMRLLGNGTVLIGTTTDPSLGKLHVAGSISSTSSITSRPGIGATITPATNGDLTMEATSNTEVKIKLKGSDGVVRSVSLTLAP